MPAAFSVMKTDLIFVQVVEFSSRFRQLMLLLQQNVAQSCKKYSMDSKYFTLRMSVIQLRERQTGPAWAPPPACTKIPQKFPGSLGLKVRIYAARVQLVKKVWGLDQNPIKEPGIEQTSRNECLLKDNLVGMKQNKMPVNEVPCFFFSYSASMSAFCFLMSSISFWLWSLSVTIVVCRFFVFLSM